MEGLLASAGSAIRWDQLGISPVALDLGIFQLRWYALSYLAMILLGWWYMVKLAGQPGAPLEKRHIEPFALYITAGVILGGRLGYSIFYKPEIWATPLEVLKPWNGGMSFHGGFIGVIAAIWLFCRVHRLNMLRVCDYIACATPFGLVLVRLANFTNGELWGRPTSLPWGMIFPGGGNVPRHPSQLYEAGLEGIVLFIILAVMVRMGALKRPGLILGSFIAIYAFARIASEFFREPDPQLGFLWGGLTMGMLLSVPMIIAGAILIVMAWRRAAPDRTRRRATGRAPRGTPSPR